MNEARGTMGARDELLPTTSAAPQAGPAFAGARALDGRLDPRPLRVVWLGEGVPYAEGMRAMREAIERVDDDGPALLLLEHAPTVTITRQHGTAHVTSLPEALAASGIELVETDRGGDVTFHGPGQLVGYPILRLAPPGVRADLVGYVRHLETALVAVAHALGVRTAHRDDGATGVWVDEAAEHALRDRRSAAPGSTSRPLRAREKLTAIGVGVGRGVTRHGFALNVTTDLERYTRHIVPCGLRARGVTSLERLLPTIPDGESVRALVAREIQGAFAPRAGLLRAEPGEPHG